MSHPIDSPTIATPEPATAAIFRARVAMAGVLRSRFPDPSPECVCFSVTAGPSRLPLTRLMAASLEVPGYAAEVLVQFGANISSLRDERLPEGPRFASESLDADTANGSGFN